MKILIEFEPSEIQTELKDLTDAQLMYVRDAAEAHLDARGVTDQSNLLKKYEFYFNEGARLDRKIVKKHLSNESKTQKWVNSFPKPKFEDVK